MTAASQLGGAGFEDTDATATAEGLIAFENAALPLAVCDPGGRIVMCNRALRALLGYDLDELLGMPIGEVVAEDHGGLYKSWDDRLDPDANAVTPERRFTLWRKDGSTIVVRASSALVRDDDGDVRYVVARAALESDR
jgi:PAS domain S-box-containing protein